MPSDTPPLMTADEIDAIRGEVRRVMEAEGLKIADIAREVGVPYGTFTSWLGGTYNGRNDLKAGEAQKWLRMREVRVETQRLMPAAPRFVHTPTAEDIILVLQHAQNAVDFAVVVGEPGIGKSSAACHYTRTTPNVFKVVAHPSLSGPRALLEELGVVMGAHTGGALNRVQRSLVERLRGRNGLIVIDEAQHLTSPALDQLRSIHDLAEIGVALLGNASVFGKLEGSGRAKEFAQLSSRVGMRLNRAKPKPGDVDALLDAWAIEGKAERRMLGNIAKKPGALRRMTKTLKLAHMIAMSERVAISVTQIQAAYERVASDDGAGLEEG
jgi:DNA transposition AAA+ family ATPase